MGQGIFERLSDPEESPFLIALLNRPDSDAARERYVQWLDERKDPRAELIHVGMVLRKGVSDESERLTLIERFASLQQREDRQWVALVLNSPRITNCGNLASRALEVRFAYKCPRQWEDLLPTGELGSRHCETCQQNVYYCTSFQQAEEHALRGECIAVSSQLVGAAHERYCQMVTGRPDPLARWAQAQLGNRELPLAPKLPPPKR